MHWLFVSRRNFSGIAKNMDIFADFGDSYQPNPSIPGPPSKRFKGALDALFANQRSDRIGAAEEDEDAANQKKVEEEAKKVADGGGCEEEEGC